MSERKAKAMRRWARAGLGISKQAERGIREFEEELQREAARLEEARARRRARRSTGLAWVALVGLLIWVLAILVSR